MFAKERKTQASMRGVVTGMLAAVLASMVPLSAMAEMHPQTRDGWFVGFGVGGGSATITVDGTSGDRKGGVAGSFRAGYVFHPRIGAGLETNAWSKDENGTTVTFSTGAATLFYYPSEGLVLRAGVGGGSADVSEMIGSTTLSGSQSGFAFTVGGQYEFRVTRRFGLGPQVDFSWMSLSDFDANYINGGLSFNWYFIPQ